jgi:hypothetical protein
VPYDGDFGSDQLLNIVDLLPRSQLGQYLRGGISDAQPIEQRLKQGFAYMVGFQAATSPNGLIVPTLLSCDASGNLNTNATYVAADPTYVENSAGTFLSVRLNDTYDYPPVVQFASGSPQTQTETHAVNALTLAAFGATITGGIVEAEVILSGSGTMPTVSSPVVAQVLTGASVDWSVPITSGGKTIIYGNGCSPWSATSANTAVTVTVPDCGANVRTDLNVNFLLQLSTV